MILVTGASGFLATSFIQHAINNQCSVLAIVKPGGNLKNILLAPTYAKYLEIREGIF